MLCCQGFMADLIKGGVFTSLASNYLDPILSWLGIHYPALASIADPSPFRDALFPVLSYSIDRVENVYPPRKPAWPITVTVKTPYSSTFAIVPGAV